MFVDSHVHLDLYKDDKLVDELIKEARENKVEFLINVGINIESSRLAVEYTRKYPQVYAVIGVHPHYASLVTPEAIGELKKLSHEPKVVAIGEIGLDYYRNLSPRGIQKESFLRQINLAKERSLPVVVHNRDANDDTLKIIKEASIPGDKVLFHCFSGDIQFLNKVLEMGCFISIGGPVTYKNAQKTFEVVRILPLSRLILETDSPYLAPHPHRGKTNKPSFLSLIARKIAEVKEISLEEVARATTQNALDFFGIRI